MAEFPENKRKKEGDDLYRQKKYGQASTAYTAAIADAPRDYRIHANRAACCEKMVETCWGAARRGWLECGLGDARKCVELAPAWPKGYCRLAAACAQSWEYAKDTAWENDDYDEEAAAKSVSKHAPSRVHPGCFSAKARRTGAALRVEAEDACRRGLALAPEDAYLRVALAKLRDDPDHKPRDAATYPPPNEYASDDALRRPEAAAKRKEVGNAKFAEKEYALAERTYAAALALDPRESTLYANRSACRAHQSDYRGALRDAEKCVALDEKWAKGRLRLATALYGLGEYGAAQEACDVGLAFDPDSTAVQKLRLRCERETKEPLAVQREMHRLREDQRKNGSLKETLAGLKEAGNAGGGPNLANNIESMMSQMGMPPGIANMSGLDMAAIPEAAKRQPDLSEAQMRRVARERAGVKAAPAPSPPPPADDALEVGADGAFEA